MNILLPFLLLHLLHHISCLLAISNENAVKKIYGRSLINSTFDTYFKISWTDCMEKCKSIRKCRSINYIRKSGFCELNDGDRITNSEGLQTRVGVIFSSKCDWNFEEPDHCTSCSEGELCSSDQDKQCKIIGCPPPPPVAGAEILGNLFTVGTKRLYRCSNGVQQVSVCQGDGNWSPVNIFCSCGEFKIENALVYITEYEDGRKEASITCNDGYFHRNVNRLHCSATKPEWTNIKQVGCMAIYIDPWTIVYRTVKGLKKNPKKVWNGDEETETGEFRNNEVLSNWNSTGIKFVKIDIKDSSDQIVANLIFNGTGSGSKNWFSFDRLINSTWDDLTGSSKVDIFSIEGVRVNFTSFLRWTILNMAHAETDKTINCSTDLMWFAVTRAKNYPCNTKEDMSGRVLVYSNSHTGVSWEDEHLRQAEEMVVSVLFD